MFICLNVRIFKNTLQSNERKFGLSDFFPPHQILTFSSFATCQTRNTQASPFFYVVLSITYQTNILNFKNKVLTLRLIANIFLECYSS